MAIDRELILGTKFVADISAFAPAINKLRREVNNFATAMNQLRTSMSALDKDYKRVSKGVEDYGRSLRDNNRELSENAKTQGNVVNKRITAEKLWEKEQKAIAKRIEEQRKRDAKLETQLFKEQEANRKKLLAQNKEVEKQALAAAKTREKLAADARKRLEKIAAEVKKTEQAYEKANKRTEQYLEAKKRLSELYPKTAQGLAEVGRQLDSVEKSAMRRAASIRANNKLNEEGIRLDGQKIAAGQRANIIADKFLQNLQLDTIARIKNEAAQRKQMGATSAQIPVIEKATKSFSSMSGMIGTIDGALNRFYHSLKTIASYGIASAAIYGVVRAFRAGISEIIDYDQAMKNIQAITGATGDEMLGLGAKIRQVAVDTKFSTGEVAQGVVLLGQAGFTASESLSMVEGVSRLATATLSDMKFVTDLVTTTVRAFNLNASETGRVVDVMANAINKSKLTIDKLRIAFNFVGAAAAQGGLTLEQTASSMMVLANNGLRASTIGTGLRQVLSRLVAPNRRLREAFEEHSISLDKVNPRTAGWEAALANLLPTIWDSEKGVVDMGKAYELFGLRGAQAIAVIAKSIMSGEYRSAIEKTYEIGTAAKMAEKQMEGLGVQIKNLADRMKVLALGVGDAGLTGILKGLISILRSAAEWLIVVTEDGVGGFVKSMLVFETTLIAVVIPLIYLVTKIQSLYKWLVSTRIVMLALSKTLFAVPIINWIAAISLAITVGYGWLTMLDRTLAKLGEQATKILGVATSLRSYSDNIKDAHERLQKGQVTIEYYNSLVERLATEHKELAKDVDLTSLSYEELEKWLRQKTIEKEAEAIENYNKKIKITNDYIANALDNWHVGLRTTRWTLDELIEKFPKVKKRQEEMVESMKAIVSILATKIRYGELDVETAEKMIDKILEQSKMQKQAAEEVKKYLKERLEGIKAILAAEEQMIKDTLKEMEKMPSFMQSIFDQLDGIRKADFIKEFQQMSNRIVAYTRTAKLLKMTEFEMQDGIREIQEEMLRKFEDDLRKKEVKEMNSLEKRSDLLEKNLAHNSEIELLQLDKLLAEKEISEEEYSVKKAEIELELAQKILSLRESLLKDVELLSDKEVDKADEVKQKKIQAEIDFAKAKIALMKVLQMDEGKIRDLALQKVQTQLDQELFSLQKNVDRKLYTVKQGELKKLELEKNSAAERLKIVNDFYNKAKESRDKDEKGYQDALDAKTEAKRKFYEAEKAYDDAFQKLREEQNEKMVKDETEKLDKIKEKHEELRIALSKPIRVEVDTSPAEAALASLTQKYKDTIAGLMAKYAEIASDYNALGNQWDRMWLKTLQSSITKHQGKLENIKKIFEGGTFKTYQTGGYVNKDGTVEKGEFVMKPSAVQRWGVGFLEWLNAVKTPKSLSSALQTSKPESVLKMLGLRGASPSALLKTLKPQLLSNRNLTAELVYNNNFTVNEASSPQSTIRELDRYMTQQAAYNRSTFAQYMKTFMKGKGGMV